MKALMKARLYAGLSRLDLADLANTGYSTIKTHEAGKGATYYPGTAKLLAEALGKSLDDLFEIDEALGVWVDKEA